MKKAIFPLIIISCLIGGSTIGYYAKMTYNGETENLHETAPKDVSFYVFPEKFFIPLIEKSKLSSMVILSLGLEIEEDALEKIEKISPKLRDILLQALFDQATIGNFDGSFIDTDRQIKLRNYLSSTLNSQVGPEIRGVMITDMIRQDPP